MVLLFFGDLYDYGRKIGFFQKLFGFKLEEVPPEIQMELTCHRMMH
jgi:hypothetical protein